MLKVDAPKGALSPDLLALLEEHKAALLALLSQEELTPDLFPENAEKIVQTSLDIQAEEAEDLREYFEERAGILEYDAGLSRANAELEAARIMATYAQNKRYSWRALRAALVGYSALLAKLPLEVSKDTDGPVDSLPLGVARLAVLPGKRVLRQGVFSSAN